MVDRLRSLREPVVVVLLIALVARLVVPLVESLQSRAAGGDISTQALSFVPHGATDPLLLVVLTVLLASCVVWVPTAHARALVLTALVLGAAGVLVSVVAALALLGGGLGSLVWIDVARVLLNLVLPVLALVGLATLARDRRGREKSAPASAPAEPALTDGSGPREVEAGPDPAQEPTWQPDQAAGAAWLKAGDAAAGAAATGWGAADSAGGWAPSARPQDQRGAGVPDDERDPRPSS